MSVDLSTLHLGRKLGDGGQAEVFLVENRPGLAFKRYRPNALQAFRVDVLEELAAETEHLKLEGRPITYWATWPTETVTHRSQVIGFLMPLLANEFFFPDGNLRGKPATFAFLAREPAPFWDDVRLPGPIERVQLLAQLAGILQQLHHRKMVFGDLSWSNVQWAQTPVRRVILLDCDGIRLLKGAPVARQLDTPDWTDPYAIRGSVPDRDRDCYKLALMVLRVLSQHLTVRLSDLQWPALQGLPAGTAGAITDLLQRAAGPAGSRPSATEWRHALEGRPARQVPIASPRAKPAMPPTPPVTERQWNTLAASSPSTTVSVPSAEPTGAANADDARRWKAVAPPDDLS